MAYRIEYGTVSLRRQYRRLCGTRRFTRLKYMAILAASLTLLVLGYCGFFDFLIPGDKEITTNAFYGLVEDVREGEPIKDAITAFCEEIIENASYT